MLWLIKFPLLLHWVVVAVKYVRLDEGERLFDSSVTALFPNLLKSSKEIETILTFDLKSLVNSPSEVIKIKQFKHNGNYEIGILLQFQNKQYQVQQILQINETLSNGVVNFVQTNFTYYIEDDEKLKCEDFTFISNQSVQVLCFKDKIHLYTLNQEMEINRTVLDTQIINRSKKLGEIFYYSEQQLSLILIESIEQESILIFVQGNSIQKIIFLKQYILQNYYSQIMDSELIEAKLWQQQFIIIFTKSIIQFNLTTGRECFYFSSNLLNKIILVGNNVLIESNNNQYLYFLERFDTFVPSDYQLDTQQNSDINKSVIINRAAYKIKDQCQILIGQESLNFDLFEVIYQVNGLLIIKDTTISLYQISNNYNYIEMNKEIQDYNMSYLSDFSLLANDDTMIFQDESIQQQKINMSNFDHFVNLRPIISGPYGVIEIYDDPLKILNIQESLFCVEEQYEFIFFLLLNQEYSQWIIQQNRILYYILCHNQQVVQRSEIMLYQTIIDEIVYYSCDRIKCIINIDDMSVNTYTTFNINIQRQSAEIYNIKVNKVVEDQTNHLQGNFQKQTWNNSDVNFKNDTIFIFRDSLLFNGIFSINLVYQFQDCEIMDLILFSQNSLLIIFKNQTTQISLANYKLMEGKIIKLKNLPTFGYMYRKIFDIKRNQNIITLLIENEEQKQFLAVYKINLVKIDCQVALIEYNADIKYAFQEDRYLQLDFKQNLFKFQKYYEQQYFFEFPNIKQFKTFTKVKFKIRNQLVEQILTLNLILNDFSSSLVACQDTVEIEQESLLQLKVQDLFYGFISNITCQNCEIKPIFHMMEKYQFQDIKADKFNDQLIRISAKYIIILIFNSKFLIFNKQFQLLNELNVIQDFNNYSTISSLNICDTCFLFRVVAKNTLLIYVKQIIDYEFKIIFKRELMVDTKFAKIQVTEDFIIILSKHPDSLNQDIVICLYKFVLDGHGEIDLKFSQLNVKYAKIQNFKIKQIQQYIIIVQKIINNEYKLSILDKETFYISNYTINFKNLDISLTLNSYQLKLNIENIELKYCVFSMTQIYLGHIQLTQPIIEIDLNNPDDYSHFLIAQNTHLFQHINYISDNVAIITLRYLEDQSQLFSLPLNSQNTINIYQLQERYVHPIQSICKQSIYKFQPFMNNTFIFTSPTSVGLATIQDYYQIYTKEHILILQAHDMSEQTAIVKLIIIQDRSIRLIQLLMILIFTVYLQVNINYQKLKLGKCQQFKCIDGNEQ